MTEIHFIGWHVIHLYIGLCSRLFPANHNYIAIEFHIWCAFYPLLGLRKPIHWGKLSVLPYDERLERLLEFRLDLGRFSDD
jgi:hypothetical protein